MLSSKLPTSVFILLYVHGCMAMSLELSYHPWCHGQLSSLSLTYLMIDHLYVETTPLWDLRRKFSLFQEYYWFQNWSAQIGAVDENLVFPFFLDFGWWINEHWRPSICLSKLHMCENFDFLYLEFMFILEVVKVHWPDDKSLTMSLNANFETCLIWGVAHTTKDDWFCKGQLPHASKSIWSIVLLQIEEKFE